MLTFCCTFCGNLFEKLYTVNPSGGKTRLLYVGEAALSAVGVGARFRELRHARMKNSAVRESPASAAQDDRRT